MGRGLTWWRGVDIRYVETRAAWPRSLNRTNGECREYSVVKTWVGSHWKVIYRLTKVLKLEQEALELKHKAYYCAI